MSTNALLYIIPAIITTGCTLLGLGVGKLFNEIWAGILMGLGIGMIVTTIILLKTVGELGAEKDMLEKNN